MELSIGACHRNSYWCVGDNLKGIWKLAKPTGNVLRHGTPAAGVFAGNRENHEKSGVTLKDRLDAHGMVRR